MTEIKTEYGKDHPESRVGLQYVCLVCGKVFPKYPDAEPCALFVRVVFDGDVVEWSEPGVRVRRVWFDDHEARLEVTLHGHHRREPREGDHPRGGRRGTVVQLFHKDGTPPDPDTSTSSKEWSGARERIEQTMPDSLRGIIRFPEDDDEDQVTAFGLPGRGRAAK